jgi:O-antigen/teichoic acid export membrane protein
MEQTNEITKEASVTTKNISNVVLLRVFQYPFLLLAVILIPRVMGPEIYGKYALLISINAMAGSLVYLGVGEIFGRFIPEFAVRGEWATIRRLSSNIFYFKCVIDLLASVVLFSMLHYIYNDRFPNSYFILIVVILLVVDLGSIPYFLLFGLNKLAKYSLRDPFRRALSLILILILFHYYGLIGAIVATLVVESSLAILYFFWTRKYFRIEGFGFDLSLLKPYLKFGFIFYISIGVLNVWQRLGNSLIEYMTRSSREVALFDIPNQIFLTVLNFIPVITVYFVPVFTELLLAGKEGKLINWSILIMKYTGILCMIIFLGFILTGPDLIPIIIGSKYKEIFPNGVVLLSSIFPMNFAQLGVVFSIVYKEPGKYLRALCFAFSAFLVVSILLIPKYASMGCSIATFISCMVLAVVLFVYFREKLFPCVADGFKIIALGLIFVPFLFLKGNLITNLFLAVCSVLAYILLLFASRVLNLGEIKVLFRAIRHQPEEL